MNEITPIGGESPETRDYAYTPAMCVGDLIFISGQIALDEAGELVGEGDFKTQGNQIFRRLSALLERSGSGLECVVKVTGYLTSLEDFDTFVALRRHWLSPPYPADTTVEVSGLARPGALLEIEAVAVVR